MTDELITRVSFRRVEVRCVGGTWHFVGVDANGQPIVERISADGAGGWTHEIASPPDRMEDWPTCVCGHARLDHDMWGTAECGARASGQRRRCGCREYVFDDLPTEPARATVIVPR